MEKSKDYATKEKSKVDYVEIYLSQEDKTLQKIDSIPRRIAVKLMHEDQNVLSCVNVFQIPNLSKEKYFELKGKLLLEEIEQKQTEDQEKLDAYQILNLTIHEKELLSQADALRKKLKLSHGPFDSSSESSSHHSRYRELTPAEIEEKERIQQIFKEFEKNPEEAGEKARAFLKEKRYDYERNSLTSFFKLWESDKVCCF